MTLLQDLRYGIRTLRKSPGFTGAVVLSLALGIGANTAIFSVIDHVLLSPLDFEEPDRMVMLWTVPTGDPSIRSQVSVPDFRDWVSESTSFESVGSFQNRSGNLTGEGTPVRVRFAAVSPGFFPAMGAEAVLGRTFIAEDDEPGNGDRIVIAYSFWQRHFGGASDVIGDTIVLDDRSRTVIGVAPEGFAFPDTRTEIWTPIGIVGDTNSRGARFLTVVARLADPATVVVAQAEMSAIAARLAAAYPASNQDRDAFVQPLHETVVGDVRPALMVVWGAVGFVFLIVCANVINMLLARARAREREIAVRMAIGAGRGRVVRQLLTESLLLAAAGGGVGIPLAIAGVDLIPRIGGTAIPRINELQVDTGVFAFSFFLTLATGILFGLLPALGSSRADVNQGLKAGSGNFARSSHGMTGAILVAGEIALALMVLIGAGLLIRTFQGLTEVDPGFNMTNLMTMRVEPPFTSNVPEDPDDIPGWIAAERTKAALFYREVQERVGALPGVRAVAAVNRMPLSGNWWGSGFRIEGREADTPSGLFSTFARPVLPGYFGTMEIPLVGGRRFTMQDESSAMPVVLINQTAARRYWPDQDPIGRQLIFDPSPPFTIVGIVGDVRHNRVESDAEPIVYTPLAQAVEGFSGDFGMDMVVRFEADPSTLVEPIRETIQSLNPNLPVFDVRSMNDVLAGSIADRRFYMILLTLMGALTLVLSAIGTYSVIAYSTSQRMRELGIRVALGAGRVEILKLVVGRGVGLTLAGIVVGLGGAFALTRVLGGVLFGVTPTDPSTFAIIAAGLTLVALVSCCVPARRAAKVDPGVVLREE